MSKTKRINQKNILSSNISKNESLISNTGEHNNPVKALEWVKGLIAVTKATPDFNHKEIYRKYIFEKYSE